MPDRDRAVWDGSPNNFRCTNCAKESGYLITWLRTLHLRSQSPVRRHQLSVPEPRPKHQRELPCLCRHESSLGFREYERAIPVPEIFQVRCLETDELFD